MPWVRMRKLGIRHNTVHVVCTLTMSVCFFVRMYVRVCSVYVRDHAGLVGRECVCKFPCCVCSLTAWPATMRSCRQGVECVPWPAFWRPCFVRAGSVCAWPATMRVCVCVCMFPDWVVWLRVNYEFTVSKEPRKKRKLYHENKKRIFHTWKKLKQTNRKGTCRESLECS